MKLRYLSFLALALGLSFAQSASADDKAVGKQYKPNPSATMKPYHLEAIPKLNAESAEVVVEKEVRENVPLLGKANTWSEAGFTIRPIQAQYLEPTAMAPSNDPRIMAIAQGLRGVTPMETAKNVFKFANDGTDFEFYLNSKKGALGALDSKKGNCCDQSHLVVALLRACGVPARYSHCNPCKFTESGMVVGHVWPEARIDGKWVIMDTSSEKNSVGEAKNFKPVGKPKYYTKLPF